MDNRTAPYLDLLSRRVHSEGSLIFKWGRLREGCPIDAGGLVAWADLRAALLKRGVVGELRQRSADGRTVDIVKLAAAQH
jgi:hypothetical protein